MDPRRLRRLLSWYAGFLLFLLLGMQTAFSLSTPKSEVVVESWWKDGKRVNRRVFERSNPPAGTPVSDVAVGEEVITGEGPLLTVHPLPFEVGLVPGRDGVKAELDGKVAYATVDDLLSGQAYDRAHLWVEASFGWGTHRAIVLNVLSEQLGVPSSEVEKRAKLSRVRFERRKSQAPATKPLDPSMPRPERITESNITRELVLDAMREMATHLARAVDENGRFRYMIDAPTNVTLPGYNWPRHSGATFFLAQAAGILDDPFIRYAALRAAARVRDEMLRRCGANKCVTEEQPIVEIGSTALALIAFTEIVRTDADNSYRPVIADLTRFLRSQQRPDGEFMHQYNRQTQKPVDVQFLYYSGEATLALARAHRITNDPEDLAAARRALSRLSGSGWSFFGSRYHFSEEHWTCQSIAELWDRAPDRDALAFCGRWHEYQRKLQQNADESPFDAEGAFNFGPLVSPRITPASSRGEAAGALYEVLLREQKAGRDVSGADMPLVDRELRRAMAFVLRNQFHPGPTHLFADPRAIRGGMPGSPVDWQLRIDYVQHAGSMMIRWLDIDALRASK